MADEMHVSTPNDGGSEANLIVNISGEQKILQLTKQVTELETELDKTTAKAERLDEALKRANKRIADAEAATGLQKTREELSRFKALAEQSVQEFKAFLLTANLDDVAGSNEWKFEEYFDSLRRGCMTTSKAITTVKTNFQSLIEENWGRAGGVFDTKDISEFVAKLTTISDKINDVTAKVDSLSASGGGGVVSGMAVGGIGELPELLEKISSASASMGASSQEAYEPVINLVKAITEYANVDVDKIYGISQAFANIAAVGAGTYNTKSIENIILLATKLRSLSEQGYSQIRFDFKGLNELHVRKASIENVATYLPTIASVDSENLQKIASIDWSNINDLKVSKAAINGVREFTDQLRRMYDTHAESGASEQIKPHEELRKETSWVEGLTKSYNEHKAAVDLAIQAEQEKATVSERVASALKEERRAADETTISQEKHANALSQIEFGAQYRNIEDLKASLKGSGVEDDFIDKVSESFRDLKGEITSVKTSWEDLDSSGRRTREVIVNAMTEAGDSIQRVVRYVREVNNEGVASWTPRTSGSATINYSNPAERAKNAAAEQARAEKAAYDDARVAVRQYYDALRMLAKEKDGVRLGANGYEPVGEQYKNLADTLNRTKTAFDLVTNEENKNNLSKEHQAQLTRLITDENNKYETLLGNLAIKEADAAQAARDRADAEYQKQANIELARMAEEEASGAMDHTATIAQEKYGALAGMYDQTSKSARESAEAMQMAWSVAERENRETERASRESSQALKEKYDAERNYTTALTQGEAALRDYSAAENSRNEASRKAYGNIKAATDELRRAKAAYDGTPESVKNLQEATRKYNLTLNESKRVLAETGDNVRSFGDKLKNAVSQFSMWFSMSRVIMSVYREIRKMISTSIELDQTMTQLRIVTKASNDEMQRFGETAAASAKKVGASITDLTSSATTFARLGYSLSESSTLAEYTTMLQNVGNIDVTDAQNAITAIVKAYKDEIDIDNIEDVMNRLVVVGKMVAQQRSNTLKEIGYIGQRRIGFIVETEERLSV